MKQGFSLELRKMTGLKFWIILVLALILGVGVTVPNAKQYALVYEPWDTLQLEKEVSSMSQLLLYSVAEDKLPFYQALERADELKWEALEQRDIHLLIQAKLLESQTITSSKEYGITYDPDSAQRYREMRDICEILTAKGIGLYREPSLGEAWDGTASVTHFMRDYLFLLLPLAVALVTADCLSAEIRRGSIKTLLALPASRTRLLARKYGVCCLSAFFILLAALLGAWLGGTIFAGPGDPRYPIYAQASFFTNTTQVLLLEWQVWLRVLCNLLAGIAFFSAISLLVGVLLPNSFGALILSTAVCLAGTVLGRAYLVSRRWVLMALYCPFSLTDGYLGAVGTTTQELVNFQSNVSGVVSLDASKAQVLSMFTPGYVPVLVLAVWASVLFLLDNWLFGRKDVT